jgi:Family of unknown function (DUF5681)
MSNPETQRQDDKDGPNESKDGAAKGSLHDYEVGYCRPPKQHQFQRGQSGNPRGRRREPVSKKATWQKLMNELVSLHEKGKTRRVTKYECLCLSHLTKAIKGDTRSTKFVIEEAERAGFGDLGAERALIPQDSITPSGLLFESIDPNRFSTTRRSSWRGWPRSWTLAAASRRSAPTTLSGPSKSQTRERAKTSPCEGDVCRQTT